MSACLLFPRLLLLKLVINDKVITKTNNHEMHRQLYYMTISGYTCIGLNLWPFERKHNADVTVVETDFETVSVKMPNFAGSSFLNVKI